MLIFVVFYVSNVYVQYVHQLCNVFWGLSNLAKKGIYIYINIDRAVLRRFKEL